MFKVKLPSGRYRDATVNEVLEAASEYAVDHYSIVGKALLAPDASADYLKKVFNGLQREKFGVIFLNTRHQVIAFEFLFAGTIDGTSVYPREVVKRVLELNAAAVVLAHNHPSGNPEPSQADERITKRLKAALDLVDVRVLDHIIVTQAGHTSLANRGMV